MFPVCERSSISGDDTWFPMFATCTFFVVTFELPDICLTGLCTSWQDIYDESCTFTDEIDTYQKDKFIKGTKALFVASESQVELLGDVDVLENGKKLQFRFQETLAFEAQLKLVLVVDCIYIYGCGCVKRISTQKLRFNFPVVHPKAQDGRRWEPVAVASSWWR